MPPVTSKPRSLLKNIAATLASATVLHMPSPAGARSRGIPIMGLVVITLLLLLLAGAPRSMLRAAEPNPVAQIEQINLPTPTPRPTITSTSTSTAPLLLEVIAAASMTGTDFTTLSSALSSGGASAIASSTAPTGTVLVDRLRLRAGPAEEYPILERTFTGDTLQLIGQTGNCAWLLVISPTGQQGWVSGAAALIARDAGCALLPPTQLIISTPTVSPTPTQRATATNTRTATPTRTPTPPAAPEIALRPAISHFTPTPLPTPTRPVVPTSTPTTAAAEAPAAPPTANPFAALAAVGPRSVSNLLPVPDTETRLRTPFSWVADAPLAEGQLFEVAFWRRGQPQEEAQSWTAATPNSTLSANTYEQLPGDYFWGVWLGAMVDGDYQRLRFLGGGNLLRVQPEASFEVAPPSATNCPPTAPCK